MIPVRSSENHDPENGSIGDCDRACVASILELPIEAVPHFYDYSPDENGDKGNDAKREWLKRFGLTWIELPYAAKSLEDLLEFSATFIPDAHWTLTAKSKNGVGHCVVCHKGAIVWDPSYWPTHGIVGPLYDEENDQGFYWFGFVAML